MKDLSNNDVDYTPPFTLGKFMRSNKRVRIVRGPVGSGKSTGMVMELLRRAAQQAPGPDGIRRSRAVIVRNTLSQLESTALETIKSVLRPIVHYKVSGHVIEIRVGDIHTDWILMPLDTPENVQRLLSLEVTFAWLSELRELAPQTLLDVLSRCGRYPSMMHGGPTWYGVIGETNSFSEDSEWNKILEVDELPSTWEYFIQPGARDAGAENVANLVPGYYADLIESNTPEWVEQYIDNKITPSLAGEAVFRSSFRKDFHVAKEMLPTLPSTMAVIGMDFGRNPSVVITQMDARGRVLILDEATSENMGVEQFCLTVLRPMLMTERYDRIPMGVVGDPSGIAKGQIGEESIFQALKRLGFSAQIAQTNKIDPRIRAVEKYLHQQRDGGAALLISPHCKVLIKALGSMYRYARAKNGELSIQPEKTHPWSDIADALQYAVLGHSGTIMARFMRPRRDTNRAPEVRTGGWT